MQRFDVPMLAHVYEQAVSPTTQQLPRCLAVTCIVLYWSGRQVTVLYISLLYYTHTYILLLLWT